MTKNSINLLLADDDVHDCFFFKEALEELHISAKLTTANDGVQLMQLPSAKEIPLPDAIFLDLNMPRKSGIECLSERMLNDKLKELPAILYSISFNMDVLDFLYQKGAHYYICKPSEYHRLIKVILEAITQKSTQPARNKFILQPLAMYI